MNRTAFNLATTFGLGDRLPAPGTTAGSMPASLIWFFVAWGLTNSPWLHVATTAMITAAVITGFWASDIEISRRGKTDPGAIVIDEVAGQWLTYGTALPLWTAIEHPRTDRVCRGWFRALPDLRHTQALARATIGAASRRSGRDGG